MSEKKALERKVQRNGNSCSITLPRVILELYGAGLGDRVQIRLGTEGLLLSFPKVKKKKPVS